MKYYKAEDVIRAIAEQLCWEARTEYGDKFTTEDWLEEAEDYVLDLPTIEVSEDNQVLYGADHNCILTMFGECSYNETGCSDCAVAEKIRNSLSVEVGEDCISREQVRAELDYISYAEKDPISIAKRIVDNAPSVVPSRAESKWQLVNHLWECNRCQYRQNKSKPTNYCPNCGAKMKGAV